MSFAKLLILLFVTLVLLVGILQNTEMVTLQVFFWTVSMSLIVLVLLILLVGFVLGFSIGRWKRPRRATSAHRPR